MSFIRTGLREIGLKVRRQKTRMALRHEKRLLQKSEISLGREGCSQAVNFPEVRTEIVALKKLEQEQSEVATRIAQLEDGIKQIEAQRQENARNRTPRLPSSRRKRNRFSSAATRRKRQRMFAIANLPEWTSVCVKTTRPTANC